ncbi:Rha family transcriptional regulator [Rhodoferax sp.]|uniref:Rha family transcriptional regulator n=1 Tax=Rhodoferax sp. TaxID=50421 RepID=UPI002607F6CE|nr:Rha family transcriptional regulator [Rhodoferax sp.]MDD5479503.1 Rha family transcriptional regulator [Rhodoferax sp.]
MKQPTTPKTPAIAEPQDLVLTTTTKEPRVSTQQLAKYLGNKHRSLFELVQDHRADFEQLGILRFQTGVIDGRGQPEKFAMLNEDQATLALAYSKNTKRVRELKVKLVKAFGDLRRAAAMRKTEYLPEYHHLHDALHVLANGSPNERHVHANVNRLLNKFAGIESGQRASAALPQQALLIVGQLVASKTAQGATDHHDAYPRIKNSLQALTGVIALEVAGHA